MLWWATCISDAAKQVAEQRPRQAGQSTVTSCVARCHVVQLVQLVA
jgi:hypothetical protein